MLQHAGFASRALLPFLLLFTIFPMFGGCAHDPAKPSDNAAVTEARGPYGTRAAAVYMPINLGYSWEYERTFLGEKGKLKVAIVKRDDQGFFVDNQGGSLRITPFGLRDRKRYLLFYPLETGQRWRSNVEVNIAEHFEIVADNDDIAVPAGSFRHCLTVRSVTNVDAGVRMVNLVSYAPYVGMIRTETWMENDRGRKTRQVLLELSAYHLPGSLTKTPETEPLTHE